MSRKPKNIEEPFSPEQLERLEIKGDKDVQLQRQKEGIFQRYHARRDSQSLARDVRWKRRAGVALIILVLVLLLIWIITWLLTTIGDLVIDVDGAAAKKGITISDKNPFTLSSDEDSGNTTRLSADMVNDVTNITYDWLPATLDLEADGSHNGKNYLAYTFYLSNNGKEALDYISELQSVRAAKDADEACRIMIYRTRYDTGGNIITDTDVQVYAKRNITELDGVTINRNTNAQVMPFEQIYKKVIPDGYTAPTAEEIEAAAGQPQNKELVDHTDEEIVIREFADSKTVFSDDIEVLEPGQVDKYTIVMWIEGEDPECLDDIRDGYVKLMWFFNIAEEEL